MQIRPFKAYRFNKDVVGDPGSCIAPPYDVISDEFREYLYSKNDHNIIRIIKGKTADSDTEKDNQYTRAADFLNKWIDQNALKQDDKECIYAYVQDFKINHQNVRRFSFIAKGKLEPFGKTVMPHEQTLSGPKIDRLNLQKACDATFGLVFLLYQDPQKVAENVIEKAAGTDPMVDLTDENGVRHRLFAIDSQNDINAVTDMMANKSCLIADGHHRYTTALNHYNETGDPKKEYAMLAFSNMEHEGLLVLATHRLMKNVPDFDPDKFIPALEQNFEIRIHPYANEPQKQDAKKKMLADMHLHKSDGKIAIGFYAADNKFNTLVLKNPDAMDKAAPEKSKYWRELNVAVLHKLILEEKLGIGEKQLAEKTNLQYVKDTPDAIDNMIQQVDKGEKQAAFFLNPEELNQIMLVAKQGEIMPQKSTYFYPKIYTGFTINKF